MAIVVVEVAPAGLVGRVLRVLVRDTVVHTHPLVPTLASGLPMVVSSHAIVQHLSSLLDQLRQVASGPYVLRVLLHVIHH